VFNVGSIESFGWVLAPSPSQMSAVSSFMEPSPSREAHSCSASQTPCLLWNLKVYDSSQAPATSSHAEL